MKAAILVGEQCQDEEYVFPYYFLKMHFDLDTVLCPYKNNTNAKCKYGTPIRHNILSKEAQYEEYDLVVIPGGAGAEFVRMDEAALFVVQQAVRNNAVISAICHGPQVLISAKCIPQGQKMTAFKGMKDDVINAGYQYIDEPVVKSDWIHTTIITANHYNANPEWMKLTLEQFNVSK